MTGRRKNKFRYDISFFALLIFIVINVWMSLLIKKLKNESAEKDMHIKQQSAESFRLESNFHAFRAVFCKNTGLQGARLNKTISNELRSVGGGSVMLVLYLKAYACSECNLHIIHWLIRRNADYEDFRIVAHTSNTFYLEEMYQEGVIKDPSSMVIWYDDILYDDKVSESTADLVFIDKNHVIQLLFPLDFIKDTCLFDEYLQCVETSFNRKEVLPMLR